MRRPPLFIAPAAIEPPRVRLAGQAAHRVQHTLRLRPGCRIRVSDGVETLHEVELESFRRDAVSGAILGSTALPPEPRPAVEVVQVLPKPALADRILAPCTTLGVAAFHFAPGGRTPVPAAPGGSAGRLERWRAIARQAAEQSERGRVPPCTLHASLEACVWEATADLRLVGDEAPEGEGKLPLRDALALASGVERIQWIIGPEGGFTPEERARFAEWAMRPVGLGAHILRLETAAVVAATLTAFELGRIA